MKTVLAVIFCATYELSVVQGRLAASEMRSLEDTQHQNALPRSRNNPTRVKICVFDENNQPHTKTVSEWQWPHYEKTGATRGGCTPARGKNKFNREDVDTSRDDRIMILESSSEADSNVSDKLKRILGGGRGGNTNRLYHLFFGNRDNDLDRDHDHQGMSDSHDSDDSDSYDSDSYDSDSHDNDCPRRGRGLTYGEGGRECCVHADCTNGGECGIGRCQSGECSYAPSDSQCGGDKPICGNDLECVECQESGDCDDVGECGVARCNSYGRCSYRKKDAKCPSGSFCKNDFTCKEPVPECMVDGDCPDVGECGSGKCHSGSCTSRKDNNKCKDDSLPVCDPTLVCVECYDSGDCIETGECGVASCNSYGRCSYRKKESKCQVGSFCKNDLTCNEPQPDCIDNGDCPVVGECGSGICHSGICTSIKDNEKCQTDDKPICDLTLVCVECGDAGDCTETGECGAPRCNSNGRCRYRQKDAKCPEGSFCKEDLTCEEPQGPPPACMDHTECPKDGECGRGTCIDGSCTPVQDNDACTTDTLPVCHPTLVCVECEDAADCNGEQQCGVASCDSSGSCSYTKDDKKCPSGSTCNEEDLMCEPQGPECMLDSDCPDDHECGKGACDNGSCSSIPENEKCETDALPICHPTLACVECEDAGGCTNTGTCGVSSCDASGACLYSKVHAFCPGSFCRDDLTCEPIGCSADSDCNDAPPCTDGVCVNNGCEYPTNCVIPPGHGCATDASCDSEGSCIIDVDASLCPDDVPICTQRFGCLPCSSDSHCDDENPCTLDKCMGSGSNKECQRTPVCGGDLPHCMGNGVCVECLENEHCPQGEMCGPTNECVV